MSALSTIARQEYYVQLAGGLPPPAVAKPENEDRRIKTAVETFEALRPGNAYEGRLAVTIVLSGSHAAECLREAGEFRDREDYAKRTRCRAQAASMMRAENSAKRTLEREQKLRLAGEAVAEAVRGAPAAAAAPAPQVARQAAAPQPAAVAVAPLRPAATPAVPAPAAVAPPSPEAIAKAEAFAEEAIDAAAQIRHDRGVTPACKAFFHGVTLPTDPAVIDALVRGVSPVLSLLDDVGGVILDAAA